MVATALDTFCTSLDELDLGRFTIDFGVGGIFLGVFVLLSPFSFAGVDGFAPNLVSWRRFSFFAFSLASFSDSRACWCSSFWFAMKAVKLVHKELAALGCLPVGDELVQIRLQSWESLIHLIPLLLLHEEVVTSGVHKPGGVLRPPLQLHELAPDLLPLGDLGEELIWSEL